MHSKEETTQQETAAHDTRKKPVTGWLFLAGAIVTEITGTILLDFSEGFSLPVQTTTALTLYALSFYLLTRALRSVSLSIAYATWSGIGTVAVALAGVLLHNEVVSWGKAAAIAAIIGGVVLLNFANRANKPSSTALAPERPRWTTNTTPPLTHLLPENLGFSYRDASTPHGSSSNMPQHILNHPKEPS